MPAPPLPTHAHLRYRCPMSTLHDDRRVADSLPTSWVDRAPKTMRPYLRLARYDRPVGFWLLALPCWFGLAAARLETGLGWIDLWWAVLFGIGAVAMRGAGCTYNDIVDRDLDAKVARTADRPLAAGTVSLRAAWMFLIAQCLVGLVVLLLLPLAAILTGLGLDQGERPSRRLLQLRFPFPYRTLITASARDRGIDPMVAAALIRQRRIAVPAGCPWLFPGEVEGQPVQEIRRFWRGIQASADLPDVRVHDLRHTFASLLVSGGASLEMIGKLLGHSQMKTTQRYAHLMDSPLRAGLDSVADALRSRPRIMGGNK